MKNSGNSLGFIERVSITNDNAELASSIRAKIQVLDRNSISVFNEAKLACCYFAEGIAKLLVLPHSLYREAVTPSDYRR